jgi:hypothetical protein
MGGIGRRIAVQVQPQTKKKKSPGSVAQVIMYLFSKHNVNVLSSNPNTTPKKKKNLLRTASFHSNCTILQSHQQW